MPGKHQEEIRSLLDAADMLAEFANLDSANVDGFRQRHPDFERPSWWIYQSDICKQLGLSEHWQYTQRLLREAWTTWSSESELYLTDLIKLLTSVFDPGALLDVMFSSGVHPAFAEVDALAEMTRYHKAVEFIAREPWRAKVCDECSLRFVADHAKRKYCSLSGADGAKCSAKVIKRQHLDWGRENNWGRMKRQRRRK